MFEAAIHKLCVFKTYNICMAPNRTYCKIHNNVNYKMHINIIIYLFIKQQNKFDYFSEHKFRFFSYFYLENYANKSILLLQLFFCNENYLVYFAIRTFTAVYYTILDLERKQKTIVFKIICYCFILHRKHVESTQKLCASFLLI
jgi:hypothetical protein